MTLSSRHGIRNSSPGGLRPSTLPLGHGGSPQYWLSHVDGEETFLFLSNRRHREPNPELVKGSGANHYPRAPALKYFRTKLLNRWKPPTVRIGVITLLIINSDLARGCLRIGGDNMVSFYRKRIYHQVHQASNHVKSADQLISDRFWMSNKWPPHCHRRSLDRLRQCTNIKPALVQRLCVCWKYYVPILLVITVPIKHRTFV